MTPNIPFYQLGTEKRNQIISACRDKIKNIEEQLDQNSQSISKVSQKSPLDTGRLENLIQYHEELKAQNLAFYFAHSNDDELSKLSDSEVIHSLRENAVSMMHYLIDTTSKSANHRGQKQIYCFICHLLEEHINEPLMVPVENNDPAEKTDIDNSPLTPDDLALFTRQKNATKELVDINILIKEAFQQRFDNAFENSKITEFEQLLQALPNCPYRMVQAGRLTLINT